MTRKRRFLFALALCLVLALLVPVTMTDAQAASSGNCGASGSNVKWTLDNSGTLTIYGTGAMMDYDSSSPDWNCNDVKSIRVEDGVTHVGYQAFANCRNATSAVLSSTVTSIGGSAFSLCTSLASISIPSGVTAIEPNTFYGCSKLYTVTVHDGITSIGDNAFKNCSKLANTAIPSGVVSIGKNAYSNTALTSVTLPEGLTSVGEYAFSSCTALKTATIRCAGADFGSSLSGVFSNCTALTNVTLPEGMTMIPNSFFGSCTALKSVTLPKTLTEIVSYAFSGCTGLERVEFPAGLTSIGNNAFRNCSALNKIIFWGKAPTISTNAFTGVTASANYFSSQTTWTSAKRVNYGGSLTWSALAVSGNCGTGVKWAWSPSTGVLTISGSGAMTDYALEDGETPPWADLRPAITGLEIKSGVTSIGAEAFRDCPGVTAVTIPSTVTRIGAEAFSSCTGVTEMTIPGSVTWIGSRAFYGSGLASVTFTGNAPSFSGSAFSGRKLTAYYPFSNTTWTNAKQQNYGGTVTWLGVENGLYKGRCGDNMVWSLSADHTALTFSGSGDWYPLVTGYYDEDHDWVTEYTPGAWNHFSDTVTSVVLQPGVTIIPASAFKNMDHVRSVTIPGSVTKIDGDAFSECTALTAVMIPDGVTYLGCNIFSGCTALTTVTIPDSVTYLGSYAFSGCTSLTAVMIPDGVTYLNEYTFRGCTALETVRIGSGVTSIRMQAFSGDTALARVEIKDLAAWCRIQISNIVESSPLELGAALYLNGELVTDLVIPDGVTSILEKAFSGCGSLERVTIPEGVITVGKSAFYKCSGLERVTISDSVTSIGESAFGICRSLQSVSMGSGVKTVNGLAFEDDTNLSRVEIHDLSAWCRTGFATSNYSHVTGETKSSNPLHCGADLYLNGSKVTQLTIPEDVTSIYGYAFYGCGSLERVTIPAQVKNVGSYAFHKCPNLSAVTIAEGVKTIDQYAFWECPNLSVITIPEGMAAIGYGAFSGCAAHARVNLPTVLPTLGYNVFSSGGGVDVNVSDLAAWCAADLSNYPFNDYNAGYRLYLNGQLVTNAVIPEGVTSIGNRVFSRCESIQTVTLPASLTSIASNAFSYSSQLNRIRFLGHAPDTIQNSAFGSVTAAVEYPAGDNTWTTAKRQNYGGTLTWSEHFDYTGTCGAGVSWGLDDAGTLVISGSGSMDNYWFSYDSSREDPPWYAYRNQIRNVVVRSGVKNIGSYAFYQFQALETLSIENASLTIGRSAFAVSTLRTVNFGTGAIKIGTYAFNDCDNLQTLTLGRSISFEDDMQFGYCDALESVTIRCEAIPPNAFHKCDNLSSVTLEGVKTIGSYAFETCTSLRTITIPASVTELNPGVFLRSALREATVLGQDVSFSYSVFPSGTTVHAPECSTAHAYVISNVGLTFAALEGDASKHVYSDPVWEWNEDHTAATATFSCTAHSDSRQVIDAAITSETTAPTCTEDGFITRTAAVTFEDHEYSDAQQIPGESATGHHFGGEPEWAWSEDLSSVTASFHCADCDAVDQPEVEYLDYGREEPTHVKDGSIYATVAVVYQGEDYTEYHEIVLPALGHNYGEPVWTWSADRSEAEAAFTCDCGHVLRKSGSITHTDVPATHFETGLRTFTASVTLDDATYTDQATAVLPLTPHVYDAAWTWSDDLTEASAVLTCTYGDDTQNRVAVVTRDRIDPTVEADGADVYTAMVTCGGQEYTDEQRVTLHFWSAPVWTWSEDHSTAEAAFTCANCGETRTISAAVSAQTTEPTHTADGETVYTASAVLDGETYADEQRVVLPALGHDWGTPEWSWAPDGSSAAMTIRCTGGDAEETVDATVTQSKRTEPTCTEDGSIRFIASVRFEGVRYTDNYVVTLPAIGHSWEGPAWSWSDDFASADAVFTCANCGETRTISAAVSVQTTEPTHKDNGLTVYTAEAEMDGDLFTEEQRVVLPALGHDWGTPEWTWAPDGSSAAMTLRCTGGDAEETLNAAVTQSKRTEPTCTEDGSVKFIATVRFEDVRYTDNYVVTLPALGHQTEVHGAKEATCTEPGSTGDEICTVCGEVVKPNEAIPALGHQTEIHGAKDATCTEPGSTGDEVCTVCGETVKPGETIPAKGHQWDDGVITTEPTETEEGVKTFTCAVCGETRTESIPMLEPEKLPAPTAELQLNANGKPRLTWTAVDGAAKYEVYKATSANGAYTKLFTTSNLAMTHTGAKAGTMYFYKVCAIDANGVAGEFSAMQSIRARLAAPSTTLELNTNGKPYLTWTAVDGAAKYEVYKATSATGTYTKLFTTTGQSMTHSGAAAGTVYYYKVRAVDAKNYYGVESAVQSIRARLGAPTAELTLNANGKPRLTWTAVDGAAKYEVYKATSADGTYTRLFTTTGQSMTHTGAAAGTTYFYKVRAVDAKNYYGVESAVQSVCTPLVAPSVTVTVNEKGQPRLTWKAMAGVEKYEVWRATKENGTYSKFFTTTNVTMLNTTAPGKVYFYKVRAIGTNGEAGPWSAVLTNGLTAPTASLQLNANGKPRLTWETVDGAVQYEVYRATSPDGTYTRIFTTTGLAMTHTGAVAGNTYYYKVHAVDANGNPGLFSAPKSITAP